MDGGNGWSEYQLCILCLLLQIEKEQEKKGISTVSTDPRNLGGALKDSLYTQFIKSASSDLPSFFSYWSGKLYFPERRFFSVCKSKLDPTAHIYLSIPCILMLKVTSTSVAKYSTLLSQFWVLVTLLHQCVSSA